MTHSHWKLTMAAILGLGVAFAAVPALAQSQDSATTGQKETHYGKGKHGGHFFKKADTNSDGFLTREEMRAAQEKKLDKMFEKMDTNKDSKLSQEELEQGHKEMRKKFKEYREKRGKTIE